MNTRIESNVLSHNNNRLISQSHFSILLYNKMSEKYHSKNLIMLKKDEKYQRKKKNLMKKLKNILFFSHHIFSRHQRHRLSLFYRMNTNISWGKIMKY